MQSFEQVVEEIFDVPKFVRKNPLEATKVFYGKLGRPGKNLKVIHVAGTNGKGSVCAYVESVLREAGFHVGKFTSPHLVDIRERITLDGKKISKHDFVDCYERMKEEMTVSYQPAFFEILFFIAILYFDNMMPDYVILETGLGGRLDATNSFETPIVSAITSISMDHMEYLGDSLTKIAREKAGIIKNKVPVVYWATNEEVVSVIKEFVERQKTRGFSVEKDKIKDIRICEKSIDFSYDTRYYGCTGLHVNTTAVYQIQNVAIAVAVLECINEERRGRGLGMIGINTICDGIEKTHWEGRMEEVFPDVFLDGAHNEDGIHSFLESVAAFPGKGNCELLFSTVRDKDYLSMIQEIKDSCLFQKIVITRLSGSRAADPQELLSDFLGLDLETEEYQRLLKEGSSWTLENKQGRKVSLQFIPTPGDAFTQLLKNKQKQDKLYVAGSLYLVGQIKELLETEVFH